MLEVNYYTTELFNMILDSGSYHKVYQISDETDWDKDLEPPPYFDKYFVRTRELQDFLALYYKHRVSVSDITPLAEYFVVTTDIETFSDEMIKRILFFLQGRWPEFSVIFQFTEDMEVTGLPNITSGELGNLVVTRQRIGVTYGVRSMFEDKCRASLRQEGSKQMFDESGYMDLPHATVTLPSDVCPATRPRRETHRLYFYSEEKFDDYMRAEKNYQVRNFSIGDAIAGGFYASQAKLRCELASVLTSLHGHQASVLERENGAELLEVFVSETIFSDDLIQTILAFLRSHAPTYCIQFNIYAAAGFDDSHYQGKVAVTLSTFSISGQLRSMIKEKLRNSLYLDEWPLIFDENKPQGAESALR